MSDTVSFQRRDFLKLIGVGVAGAVAGCAKPPAEKLLPYLVQPNDVLPGIPYFFASTCRECPAGCGILVKQREGRAIKVEGNPAHPLNRGGLCARGQAGLQGLYDPDRVRGPMIRENGAWKPITWDAALTLAGGKLAAAKGKSAFVTSHVTGSLHQLTAEVAKAAGGTHLVYEAFAHESLREANRRTLGTTAIPAYDLARADFVIGFGADFLETWLTPTAYARDFATLRAKTGEGKGGFVAVEPRLSTTAANSDEWVAVKPGGEMALALAMANVILTEGLAANPTAAAREAVAAYTPESVAGATDVPAETIQRLARRFAKTRPSLALAGGIAAQSEQSVALLAAVNLLNWIAGNVGQTVRFDRALDYDAVAGFNDVQQLVAAMSAGKVEALVVHGANPAYATPRWAGFAAAMAKVPFKLSLSSHWDETTLGCDLVLPSAHALESWGDATTARGVWSLQQPGMRKVPMFDSRETGEILLGLAHAASLPGKWSATWLDDLKTRWQPLHQRMGGGKSFGEFWTDALKRGGVWDENPTPVNVSWSGVPALATPELKGAGDLALVMMPSLAHFDGRGANKPWLQELPDPTSKAVWGSWVEIHPETAAKLGIENGKAVRVSTEAGQVDLPAFVYGGIRKDTIAIPLGQGHTGYGRYAKERGVNALDLLSPAQDAASGAVAYLSTRAKAAPSSAAMHLSVTQRERSQRDREIAQVIPIAALLGGAAAEGAEKVGPGTFEAHLGTKSMSKPGRNTEPMDHPVGYVPPAHSVSADEPEHEVRSSRRNAVDQGMYDARHATHRWAMAVDLNSCTGCSACVVACHAENNVPIVGAAMVDRGREMHWIRIDRFDEKLTPGAHDVRFVPMMCQHCSDAPCEIVCPVYATYHNPEGLNVQVYNRCVGTRYCSNNCPYKVRAFNWFDYTAPEKETFTFPEPLNWQLNPDVTVRSKGVMEKCTMCVQRILEAKGNAQDEGRALRDGEFQTACQQTCPSRAITFGDLLDPKSAVHQASYGERKYWVLEELNTKPGVTYRKKIQRENA
jgi:anaerobic selenocysteine-containing dehydrogenase/Fe-S-cluster-containing dehydrogenase component